MSQFSCDESGILAVYDDADNKLFDRTAGIAVTGWSLTPAIVNRFAVTDETTGLAKSPSEVEQALATPGVVAGVAAAAGGGLPVPSNKIVATVIAARFAVQGSIRVARAQVAKQLGLTEAQVQNMETEMAKRMGVSTLTMPA